MKINAIITGATGMVGEGVLHECLLHPDVEKVLVVGRRPCGLSHPKVSELVIHDFFDLSAIELKLTGFNACFFCLGISSVGVSEAEYYRITHDLALHFGTTVQRLNPDMTFNYVSGAGTDGTEAGHSRWARVKGKTENDLLKLPFRKAFMFRPGVMEPTKGLKNTLGMYKYLSWLLPVLRIMFPKYVSTLREVGWAMINSVTFGYPKSVLEVRDIIELARR